MLTLPMGTRVYMAVEPVDMRKGFNGLSAAVETVFGRNVLDGHLFLFLNRPRDRLKILWWDQDGLAYFYKRLERGTFELPRHEPGARQLVLDQAHSALLLSGIELSSIKRRFRYSVRRSAEGVAPTA